MSTFFRSFFKGETEFTTAAPAACGLFSFALAPRVEEFFQKKKKNTCMTVGKGFFLQHIQIQKLLWWWTLHLFVPHCIYFPVYSQ